jgi:hypothetical protein
VWDIAWIWAEAFLRCDGFYMLPLRDPEGQFLGALGVAHPQSGLTRAVRCDGASDIGCSHSPTK